MNIILDPEIKLVDSAAWPAIEKCAEHLHPQFSSIRYTILTCLMKREVHKGATVPTLIVENLTQCHNLRIAQSFDFTICRVKEWMRDWHAFVDGD